MNSIEIDVLFQKLDAIRKCAQRGTQKGQAMRDKSYALKRAHISMHDGMTQTHRIKKHCKRGDLEKTSSGSVMATKRFNNSRVICVYKTARF